MAKKTYKYEKWPLTTSRPPERSVAPVRKSKEVNNLVLSALQKQRFNYTQGSKRLEQLIIEFNKRLRKKPDRVIKKTLSLWIHGE
ncbi:MAG: hypothetical protein ACLFQX_03190 [Candidatus Kapaibacterium sp.]